MKSIWAISVIAAVLVLGILGSQDVYGPEEPEKLNLGGTGYNSDDQAFEIKMYVHVHRNSNPADFSVSTTLTIFQKDGTTMIADGLTSTDRLPERVKEGGNNSSVHKLTAKILFPRSELPDDMVKLFIEAELVGSDAKKISGYRTVSDITLKRG